MLDVIAAERGTLDGFDVALPAFPAATWRRSRAGATWALWHFYPPAPADDIMKAVSAGPAARARLARHRRAVQQVPGRTTWVSSPWELSLDGRQTATIRHSFTVEHPAQVTGGGLGPAIGRRRVQPGHALPGVRRCRASPRRSGHSAHCGAGQPAGPDVRGRRRIRGRWQEG
jgi:hypothetical protein